MPLQTTIDEIRNGLEQGRFHENEMSVRQGIVEPLLRGLGWPTNDTRIVYPEYSIAGGRVDYALCYPPVELVALIEAKRGWGARFSINIPSRWGYVYWHLMFCFAEFRSREDSKKNA